jgi:hypothetical protein
MVYRKRTSKVWELDKESFQKVMKECNMVKEAFPKLGIEYSTGMYKSLRKRIDEENIDISHLRVGMGANKGRKFPGFSRGQPIDLILTKDSKYTNIRFLKKRLLDSGTLSNQCQLCGQLPKWNDKELILQLDHINGINNDHRLENLRMVCPNCHTQTNTYAGKNNKIS